MELYSHICLYCMDSVNFTFYIHILPYLAHNQKGAIILQMDRVVLQVH